MRQFEITLWQDGVEIDRVIGPDFAQVHATALDLVVLYSDDGPVEMRSIPRDKFNEFRAALGCHLQ